MPSLDLVVSNPIPSATGSTPERVKDQQGNSSSLSLTSTTALVKGPGGEPGTLSVTIDTLASTKFAELHVRRGKLGFSEAPGDPNHTIYNNSSGIDGEAGWDGMKMNVYNGLQVRIGDASTAKAALSALPETDNTDMSKPDNHVGQIVANVIKAKKVIATMFITGSEAPASAELAGATRYREVADGSFLEMCMKTGQGQYRWVVIRQTP